MLQKEIKDWVFVAYLLIKEISSWFLLIGSLKMTYARVLCEWFLNFYQTERVWIIFRGMSYPNLIKWQWSVQSEQKGPKSLNFDLPKVSKIIINFGLLKVSKMTSLKIYISPVTEKLETLNLDTWWKSLKEFRWVLHLRR